MRITVFGASGGIGHHVLDQATAAGHHVTAVVRDASRVTGADRVITADLAVPCREAIERAVGDAEAVLSCIGARTKADIGVATVGTEAIVAAMRATGARRIVVVSAAPIGSVASAGRPTPTPPRRDAGDAPPMRDLVSPLLKQVLRRRYADLAAMEDVVRRSGLDWTIVRPPRLVYEAATGRYGTARGQKVRGGASISRADVAHLMLRVIGEPETATRTVGVADRTRRSGVPSDLASECHDPSLPRLLPRTRRAHRAPHSSRSSER
jgi:putative NADH-flavin reductase